MKRLWVAVIIGCIAAIPLMSDAGIARRGKARLTGITLSKSSFAGGAGDGTVVGTIGVSEQGGTFTGALSIGGTDAGKFKLSSTTLPSNLELNGTQAAGSYSISLTATQSGINGSPATVGFPVTGTSASACTSLSSTLVVSGQTNQTYNNYCITTTSGPCVSVTGSTGITISDSQIGPCGAAGNTTQAAGVYITGNSSVNVYDSYIHVENKASGCSPASHDGIEILNNGTAAVNIQGNVLARNQTGVLAYNSSNVSVVGNYILDPVGPGCNPGNGGNFVQIYGDTGTITGGSVTSNYGLSDASGVMEDGLSFGAIAPGTNSGWVASGNYLVGGNSVSGCGITVDSGSSSGTISNNIAGYYNCGIQITNGTVSATGNKALVVSGGVNAGALVTSTNGISGNACGPLTVTGNTISGVGLPNGSWYNPGDCTSIAQSGNVLGSAAYTVLYPLASTNPPPLIPPSPKTCTAISPYTTQTSKPSC